MDEETGLYYYGARYYDPRTSVWQSVDPVLNSYLSGKYNGGVYNSVQLDLYAYAGQNPIKYKDPDGRVIETAWDVFSLGLGVASLYDNVGKGNYLSATLDIGGIILDAAATAVPFVPGGAGAAIKAGRVVDAGVDALQTAKNLDNAGDAAKFKNTGENVKEGIYEFTDSSGKKYVGQSSNIPKRLKQHKKSGKLEQDQKVTTTEVLGGKTKREISEHKRIQEITGNVPARISDKVSNKVDPIGPKRKSLLE
jgi:RHS repeat-associated protein